MHKALKDKHINTNDMHLYLQVVSSTNGDMPPDDGGHSQQPIHPPNEVEVVDETK